MTTTDLLRDRTILVVGGAGLLGRAFCRAITTAGGYAIVADRNIESARTVANEVSAYGLGASAVSVDISSPASIDAMIEAAHGGTGPIHAIVNSAYPRNANYGRRFEDVTYADFNENVALHVGGIFSASQKMASYFERSGIDGHIINIASIYGVMAPRFEVYDATKMTMPVEYAATKAAVIHLTNYIAKYYFGRRVRANVISPGGILDRQPDSFLASYKSHCASTGMLSPDDICGALLFLLSPLASHVTGQNIIVDDGFSL